MSQILRRFRDEVPEVMNGLIMMPLAALAAELVGERRAAVGAECSADHKGRRIRCPSRFGCGVRWSSDQSACWRDGICRGGAAHAALTRPGRWRWRQFPAQLPAAEAPPPGAAYRTPLPRHASELPARPA